MGFHVSEEEALRWEREGIVPAGTFSSVPANNRGQEPDGVRKTTSRKESVKILVDEKFDIVSNTWWIPIATYSIANSRDITKMIYSKAKEKRAVYHVLGKHHHALSQFSDEGIHRPDALGGPAFIIIILTRLSTRTMDEDDNLRTSLKYIKDAIADMLGVDDKSKLIIWEYHQEISKKFGVKIQMRLG